MKILTLFFTYGTSLEDWSKNGSLDREINIYKKFLNYFDKIYFITYGMNDLRYASKLPENIIILPKKIATNNFLYSLLIPILYRKEITESTWLKTNQMLGSWTAVLAKLFFRKKFALRTGYTESLSVVGKNFFRKKLIAFIELLAYKSANFSIVTSIHQKDYVAKKYNITNIHVIPNGIDTEIFKPLEKKDASTKTKLLFVGRLHPEKNLLNLIAAIKDLKNTKLTIIGKGELKNDILALKGKFSLDLEIIESVPNSELPKIYNDADIYIQPSLYEGNPKTILEAMSCGLPVIATDVSGINTIINHKKNGYLCKIDTPSIINAILEVVNNIALRKSIGIAARKYIENNYAIDQIINNEINSYKKYL